MPPHNIIRGQPTNSAKSQLARDLRRQMTTAEQVLWRALRGNRLNGFHFRRQQVIGGFIADFYCHAAALVVEVDGSVHEGKQDADVERDNAIARLGVKVLRVSNDEVGADLPSVLAKINTAAVSP